MDDTPRSAMFDDVYFSAKDGAAETEHVFLNGNNLPAAWQGQRRFTIGETGFGTGLNFLMAWELFEKTAEKGAFLDFVSVEKYPLPPEDIRKALMPWVERLSPYVDKMLAQYPMRVPGFHRMVFDGRVALTLIFDDANDALPEIEGVVDAWFLDGFTPSKNPDMWTEKVFREMARLSHKGTTFSTFTAAGFVKRGLRDAGFLVEKRKGFGWKADMLGGVFEGGETASLSSAADGGIVHILGAGLAGCASAYVLKQYGFEPVLHDPNGIASGASGNAVGIINPRLSAHRTGESDFYTAAFSQTVRQFPSFDAEYMACGSLHLVNDDEKEKRFVKTAENWGWGSHMQFCSAADASTIAGISLDKAALYIPGAARINPALLCKSYAKDVAFEKNDNADGRIILANGAAALDTLPDLPIHTVRGQITMVRENAQSRNINVNIGYGGYISAPAGGMHAVGSTFQKWMTNTNANPDDDEANLKNLAENLAGLGGFEIAGHRAALRTASKDRFPVIGSVEDILVTTAHGSHGIASTLAGAHLLADILRDGIRSLGKSTLKNLAPARFYEREMRKSAKKA